MSKSINFKTLKKQYFTVTLDDDNGTVLMVTTPTKSVFDSFLAIKESLEGETLGENALDELYDIVAKLLSRNKGGIVITKAQLEDTLDFEDLILLVRAYTEFLQSVTGSKN